jgi:hypothetical protein
MDASRTTPLDILRTVLNEAIDAGAWEEMPVLKVWAWTGSIFSGDVARVQFAADVAGDMPVTNIETGQPMSWTVVACGTLEIVLYVVSKGFFLFENAKNWVHCVLHAVFIDEVLLQWLLESFPAFPSDEVVYTMILGTPKTGWSPNAMRCLQSLSKARKDRFPGIQLCGYDALTLEAFEKTGL